MDKLEEYIRKNREKLDEYTPSPEIWRGIKRDMKKGRSFSIKWLSAAAMIAIVFASAALFYTGERRKNNPGSPGDSNILSAERNSLLNETEIYYNTQVINLYQQASPLLTKYPEIEKELVVDMAHIDSICTEIKRDLNDNISNQEVIEALINNYRLKIRILEDMLDLVNQNESGNIKKEGNEL
jgi:hypothetical protein